MVGSCPKDREHRVSEVSRSENAGGWLEGQYRYCSTSDFSIGCHRVNQQLSWIGDVGVWVFVEVVTDELTQSVGIEA